MAIITSPKLTLKYLDETYLRGDEATAKRYCTEKGFTYVSFKTDKMQFSNAGSRLYQYWVNNKWEAENGFHSIITEITTA